MHLLVSSNIFTTVTTSEPVSLNTCYIVSNMAAAKALTPYSASHAAQSLSPRLLARTFHLSFLKTTLLQPTPIMPSLRDTIWTYLASCPENWSSPSLSSCSDSANGSTPKDTSLTCQDDHQSAACSKRTSGACAQELLVTASYNWHLQPGRQRT